MIVFRPQYLNNTGIEKKKKKDLAEFQLEREEKYRAAFMHFMGKIA